MTVREAENIVREHYDKAVLTDEEFFEVTEALKFIITEENDPYCMIQLSGFYIGNGDYELAYKYSEMARLMDYDWAYYCTAELLFGGYLGKPDYAKAFDYFCISYEREKRISAGLYIALIYREGLTGNKDYDKYKALIMELLHEVSAEAEAYPYYNDSPLPEIYAEAAEIFIDEGHLSMAYDLLEKAQKYLANRLTYNYVDKYIELMNRIVKLRVNIDMPGDENDLYDLLHYLSYPGMITFTYDNTRYTAEALYENDQLLVCFEGKWFRSPEDFISKAKIKDKYLMELYQEIEDIRRN